MSERFQGCARLAFSASLIYVSCSREVPREITTQNDASDQPVLRDVSLIDHASWHEYAASEDPMASHQPEQVDCGPAGWYVEPSLDVPLLEIDTNYCNYALLEQ